MNTVWDILYARRPVLNYVSPPVCEVIFSGSSNPIIILSEPLIGRVTGLAYGGFGGFQLTWNAFPGAICYNVYFIGGDNVAVILAQCVDGTSFVIPDDLGDGEIVVTPVTLEGEGPPSEPIPAPTGGGGGGTSTVTVDAPCMLTSRETFPGQFRIAREEGDTMGNLTVNFTLSGTAVNGVDFVAIPLSATIPDGMDFVLVPIEVIESVLLLEKTVTLTLSEALNYAVGTPNSAMVMLRPPLMRIVDYGSVTAPLFVPPTEAPDSDKCEWDGTFNLQEGPFPSGESFYYWADATGNFVYPEASVQDKVLWRAHISGPRNTTEDPQTWFLSVFYTAGAATVIWWGYKLGGATAAGTYTAWPEPPEISDTRATVEVELFP